MKVNNLINKLGVLIFVLLFVCQSCSSGNDATDSTPVIAAPSNLSVQVEVIGKTADKPDGDGSGKVNLKINASNAVSYKVLIDNQLKEITNGDLTYTFTTSGTKTYSIIVSAYNAAGQFVSSTTSVNIFVTKKILWSDEFNTSGAPDGNKWTYDIGLGDNGWGNSELQYYTNRPENVIVENGVLKIRAIRENYNGGSFTSARLKTQGLFNFKYGKVEISAKVPSGAGTWAAGWMLGSNINTVSWPACGEIDILEHLGREMNKIYGTFHYPGRSGGSADGTSKMITNASTEFHKYSVDWNATDIKIYVDDQLVHSLANSASVPFNHDFFIILNLAMGGNFGGAVDAGVNNATYEVDYIRVYSN